MSKLGTLWKKIGLLSVQTTVTAGLIFIVAGQQEAQAKRSPTKTAKAEKAEKASSKKGKALEKSAKGKKQLEQQARAKPTNRTRGVDLAHRAEVAQAPRGSMATRMGLHASQEAPIELSASVAFVMDQDSGEILLRKNDSVPLPIASVTKLMTGMVIAEAGLPLDEWISITEDEVDHLKGTSSRLAVGTTLTRGEALLLALMSSENRAAHALGRTYPGGLSAFVRAMNAKAQSLGMFNTRYVDPTGLSSSNQASARDLAVLVQAASQVPVLRDFSTWPSHQLDLGYRQIEFKNSNRLIHTPGWEIGLQKTGFISEAGRCLVMQTHVSGRRYIMVLLDARDNTQRANDAERMRSWILTGSQMPPAAWPTSGAAPIGVPSQPVPVAGPRS